MDADSGERAMDTGAVGAGEEEVGTGKGVEGGTGIVKEKEGTDGGGEDKEEVVGEAGKCLKGKEDSSKTTCREMYSLLVTGSRHR
ncbi:hypothetical protein ACFX2I_003070 [Malus domestica]